MIAGWQTMKHENYSWQHCFSLCLLVVVYVVSSIFGGPQYITTSM